MPRYIDAERFKLWLQENYVLYDGGRYFKDIDAQPTSDARKNVHAHWTFRQLGGWHCSKCDEQAPFWCMASTQNLAPFCPNCGAVMDEVVEEPTMEEYMYGQEGSEEDGSL